MNLPEIHERVHIVQEAEGVFSIRIGKEVIKEYKPTYDEIISVFSQSIVNLTKDEDKKVYINGYHKKIETILEEVSKEHDLTYGEKARILTNRIQGYVEYVIRWERHKDFNKEGD